MATFTVPRVRVKCVQRPSHQCWPASWARHSLYIYDRPTGSPVRGSRGPTTASQREWRAGVCVSTLGDHPPAFVHPQRPCDHEAKGGSCLTGTAKGGSVERVKRSTILPPLQIQ
ncbi:hypothetical protein E2C01_090495 [Portunus trituberculatus]|uniref:Uncharacterized protein n=1 Tax=Portunus trituberculatus TaxID=210409 RepID=A0A5B7JGR4_PORTR|nr:hypothetical protein [Portunus trituberculatus]